MSKQELIHEHAALDKQVQLLRERMAILHKELTEIEQAEAEANSGPAHLTQSIGFNPRFRIGR